MAATPNHALQRLAEVSFLLILISGCSEKSTDSNTKTMLDAVFKAALFTQVDVGKAKRPSYILYDIDRKKVVGILHAAPTLHAGDFVAWDDDDLYQVVFIRIHTRKPVAADKAEGPPERPLELEAVEAGVKFVSKMTEAANTPPPQP